MRRYIIASFIAIAALMVGTSVFAGTHDPVIKHRERHQQRRIEQGVKSGELTQGEAGKLESQQSKIQKDEAAMKSDGNLTPREHAKLTREQNRASRNIYRNKHNARTVGTQ